MPATEPRLPWQVAEQGLCVRCGACFDMCPHGLIEPDADGFPGIRPDRLKDCTGCELCIRPCPADVDFPAMYGRLFGVACDPLDAIGVVRNVYVGRSQDPAVRAVASSGGVGTELLLFMLRSGMVGQTVVCRLNPAEPWRAEPVVAASREDVLAGAQSKYTIVPQMRHLGPLSRSPVKTAWIGLPCHIHALRKLEAWKQELTDNCAMIIGLACHTTLEPQATTKLLEVHGIAKADVARLEYRGGVHWPKGIQVTLRNGEVRRVRAGDIKAAFNYLKCFYIPRRCLSCIDYSAELSDITVMDPWIRDATGGHPYSEGYSLILVRTERGQALVDAAARDGSVQIKPIDRELLPSQFGPLVTSKKKGTFLRMKRMAAKGLACPVYNLPAPSVSDRDRRRETFAALLRVPGLWAWSRDLGMRIAFSALGGRIMRLRDAQKTRRNASAGR